MEARRTKYGLTLVAVLGAGLALGCGEDLLAPATGTCPGFCPPEQLEVVDSILLDVITSDSTFTGYVLPWEATALQTYRDSSDAGDAGSETAHRPSLASVEWRHVPRDDRTPSVGRGRSSATAA